MNFLKATDKQKGIYCFTTQANLDAMPLRGWLEVAIGDAGVKKDDQGDIDSRIKKGQSPSKFPQEFKVEIDRILNPGHRDTALHTIIRETTASQFQKPNSKTYREIFRWPIPKELIDAYIKTGEFQDIIDLVSRQLRNKAGILNKSSKKKGLVIRNIQKRVFDKIVNILLSKGIDANIVCELAPRIGKTILFLALAKHCQKTHEAMFVKAYGVGLSVKTSYKDEINTWEDFNSLEFVDGTLADAEQKYKDAIDKNKMPIVFVSLNPEDYKKKYEWIHKITNPVISLLEETDFGTHCESQVNKIGYLIANKKVTRINSSGTNIGKIAKAMGGDHIDEVISYPYCMVEQDTSIVDRVYRKFYDVVFSSKINKLLENYEDEDLPNIRKILEKPLSQERFLKALFQDLYDEETIYGLSINQQAGEKINTSMIFVNNTKKAMDQLAKLIEGTSTQKGWLPEHKVLVLHGDHTDNKKAEGLTKQTLIELQTGVHKGKDKLIILTNMMGSRSYTVGEIQACLFMQEGGDLYPFNQKYSRCLSPWKDANGNILKKFGHIFMFGFDTNKTKQYELAIGVEANQVAKLTGKSLPDSIRQVLNSVSMKDVLSGRWLDADDVIKKFEDCNKLLEVANAGTKITVNDLSQEELETFGELAKGFSKSKKEKTDIDKKVKTGKTFESSNSRNSSKKKEPLLVIIERAIRRLNGSASTVIAMTSYKGNGFLDCLNNIKKNKELSKEFLELYGVSISSVLSLSHKLPLPTLDMIVHNTKTGVTNKQILNSSLGIVADDPKLWKEILNTKAIKRKINSNRCKDILVVAGGFATEVDVLVEMFGIDITKKIVYNDKYTHNCNDIKRRYPDIRVLQGDFLNLEFKMKFDVVVGNYPYKDTNKKKVGGTMNLWPVFIEKICNECLKEDGYLANIVPATWMRNSRDILRKKEFGGSKKILNDILKNNDLQHVNVGEAKKYFKEGSTFTWFIMQNKDYNGKTIFEVADSNNNYKISSGELDISNVDSIRYGNTFFDLSIHHKAQQYKTKWNFSSYETFKHKKRSDTQSDTFAFPYLNYKINGTQVKEKGYSVCYLSEKHPVTNKRKIHIPYVGPTTPYVDDGKFGVVHGQVYELASNELVESAEDVMYSKLFKFLYHQDNGLHNESGVMNVFFKPDLSKRWTNEQLYKEINLTQQEIEYIENYEFN